MDEVQAGPSCGRPLPLPLTADGWADLLGYARYVRDPYPSAQWTGRDVERGARRDVGRMRFGRTHYIRLAWFIELACRKLDDYRQEVEKLADKLEKEHIAHADTHFKLTRLEDVLLRKTMEYTKSANTISSRLEAAQKEIGLVLNRRGEVDEVPDVECGRSEEVLVTLPVQPEPHWFIRSVRRVIAWLQRGNSRHERTLSDIGPLLLKTKSFNGSDVELSILEAEEKPSTSNAESIFTKSGKGKASAVNRDGGTHRNWSGCGTESSAIEEWAESHVYDVMDKLWRLHGAVRKTLLAHAQNVQDKLEGRGGAAAVLRRRRATRLLAAQHMSAADGLQTELRDAKARLSQLADALAEFGARAWPGEQPHVPKRPRSAAGEKRRPLFQRVCALLCCARSRR